MAKRKDWSEVEWYAQLVKGQTREITKLQFRSELLDLCLRFTHEIPAAAQQVRKAANRIGA
jgi:hypothetical protein